MANLLPFFLLSSDYFLISSGLEFRRNSVNFYIIPKKFVRNPNLNEINYFYIVQNDSLAQGLSLST
jgi:hypothetical protein